MQNCLANSTKPVERSEHGSRWISQREVCRMRMRMKMAQMRTMRARCK
jgi:hypothetical protein